MGRGSPAELGGEGEGMSMRKKKEVNETNKKRSPNMTKCCGEEGRR